MKNYEFVVWLEGYLEICPGGELDAKKLRVIRNYMNLVKEVDGQLGPLNKEIYDLISGPIEHEAPTAGIQAALAAKITSFLTETFPESCLHS
jgi:hypothetical protein